MNIHLSPAASRRQNAHLTFKHNQHMGRHGWLRLTPAYSVGLVREVLSAHCDPTSVLDPFSGTGTTVLTAAYMGLRGTGLEINPFLVWFSSVKTKRFADAAIRRAGNLAAEIGKATLCTCSSETAPPPIHNVERWWDPSELDYLCRLKAQIDNCEATSSDERDLLLVAFCRTVIALSNAAFNHQSMSFKKRPAEPTLFDLSPDHSDLFRAEVATVLEGAADAPAATGAIVAGDARNASKYLSDEYDLLVTSPPYPNRMSYIRELRPYMYWLGYLTNGRDAGELDWRAIGGTWGIATSRLLEWETPPDWRVPPSLETAIRGISSPSNKNGRLLANYVSKYFHDMRAHFMDLSNVLRKGAEVHYVVGNSSFYGVLLPVETIYHDMLAEVGFKDLRITRLRKRNSKKELYEFDVSGRMA